MNQQEKEKYNALVKKINNQKKNIEQLTHSLRIKRDSLFRVHEEKEFIKRRVIDIYGQAAFMDLINHVDYPDTDSLIKLMEGIDNDKETKKEITT